MLHEPETTITNFLLAAEAFLFAGFLFSTDPFPGSPYWISVFFFLGLSSSLGGLYHGRAIRRMMPLIFLSVAGLAASVSLATLSDLAGGNTAWQLRWPAAGVTLLLFVASRFRPDRLIGSYAAVKGIIAGLVLLAYIYAMAAGNDLPGLGWIAAGFGITLAGTVLYLLNIGVTLIRRFDRNGCYHLVQMVATLCVYWGLRLR